VTSISRVAQPNLRKFVWLATAIIALASVAMQAVSLWQHHQAGTEAARKETATAARLVSQHMESLLNGAEGVLSDVTAFVPVDHPERVATWANWQRLKPLAARLPHNSTLWVVGADGRALLSSNAWPTPDISIAGREWYEALKRKHEGIFISRFISGRTTGRQVFILAKAVRDLDGNVVALVSAGIDVQSFPAFSQSLKIGENLFVAIVRQDGEILLTEPSDAESYSRIRDRIQSAFYIPANSRPSENPVQRREQIFELAPIGRHPVSAMIGVSVPSLLEDAATSLPINTYLIGGFLGIVLLLAWMSQRALSETERTQALLRETNHNLESTVAARTAELNEALLTKDRFLASLSHDLRQPLQAAHLFLSVAKGGSIPAKEAALDRLEESLVGATDLLQTCLNLSKGPEGAVEPQIIPFHIGHLIESLVREQSEAAREKALLLRHVKTDLVGVSDPLLLKRILRNFLSNAVRHTANGKILIGCRRQGNIVRLCVWGTGPGIRDEHRNLIFQEFVQLHNVARNSEEGYGLGLASARKMAELLGHEIGMESRAGWGSVFFVSIPVAARGGFPTIDQAPDERSNLPTRKIFSLKGNGQ
jgi:signal transduction histidine kinase